VAMESVGPDLQPWLQCGFNVGVVVSSAP
jgi:hypothetical protein